MGPPDLTNVLLFLDQRKSDLGRVGDQRERKQEPVTRKEESSEQVREFYMGFT